MMCKLNVFTLIKIDDRKTGKKLIAIHKKLNGTKNEKAQNKAASARKAKRSGKNKLNDFLWPIKPECKRYTQLAERFMLFVRMGERKAQHNNAQFRWEFKYTSIILCQ